MGKTILAIGGHIGDMELTAGGLMATNYLDGGKNITLALTAGERGNPPHLTQKEYRVQKIAEAKAFMDMMNGEALVLKYADGELPNNEEVRREVAEIIVKYKPDVIVTHWHSKMHKDHNATHYIVQDAQFIAGVVGDSNGNRHYAPVYFCENWEDDNCEVPVTWTSDGISFYATQRLTSYQNFDKLDEAQRNGSGRKYYYVAIS